MSVDGQFQKAPMVRFERTVPGPIDRVWDFITSTERLPAWFGQGRIEPREGGTVTLMDGHIRGVVTQWKPRHRLSYTWNVFSPGESESAYPESYLTIELETHGEEVQLALTHLPVLERFEKQNAMGWHTFLDVLEAALRGEMPQPRGTYAIRNAQRYGVDLNNLAR
jgi:uncharacterized protein YndB with AHSA1/START domain